MTLSIHLNDFKLEQTHIAAYKNRSPAELRDAQATQIDTPGRFNRQWPGLIGRISRRLVYSRSSRTSFVFSPTVQSHGTDREDLIDEASIECLKRIAGTLPVGYWQLEAFNKYSEL